MKDLIAKAQQNLHEALRLNPHHVESYSNLGRLYYKQCLYLEAIPYFERALRIDQNYWEAHYFLAHCLTKLNRASQAAVHYFEVIQLQPNHADAHYNLGLLRYEAEEYQEAEYHLVKSLELDPNNAMAAEFLGHTELALGQMESAFNAFTKALVLNPNSSVVHHNLAVLQLGFKNKEKALFHFEEALKFDPQNETARHMREALTGNKKENENEDDKKTPQLLKAPRGYVQSLFDQYADYYNAHVKEKLQYKVPGLLRAAVAKVLSGKLKTGRVLDLGCGTGLCGIYFRDLAYELVGVDLSPKMIEKAETLGAYDKLEIAEAEEYLARLEPEVEAFDLIIAADVLVYFGNLEDLFKGVSQKINKNGHFAFTVEALGSDLASDQQGISFRLNENGRYAHSADYIQNLAQQYGFNILLQESIILRENDGQAVHGFLYVGAYGV